MDKINGYSEQEARALIDFIAEGKKRGEALSALFASYGKKCGRAAGSVRNYYYQFLKCEDARAKEILNAAGFSSPSEFAAALAPLLGEREKISDELLHAYAKKASVNKNIKNCSVFFDEADLFRVLKASVGG